MIVPLFDTMLVQQGEGSGTPTEPHHTPSPEAQPTSHTTHSSSTLPPVTTTSIPTVTPSDTTPIRQYTRRARIAQSSALPTVADEPESLLRDISQMEACPTDSGFIADQDRETIANLQRQYSELAVKFEAQEIEITRLKARVNHLEDRQEVAAEETGDDAPIKGRNLDEGEAAAERASDDTEEMATVLTSMDVATVLASEAAEAPTGSGSIPTVGPPTVEVPTDSDVVPTTSLVFATATVVTPYRRRKDNYAKIYKFQSQQRKPLTKKQNSDYYMAVIKSNLGWKVKDFRGMTFKEVEAKFNSVWKQMEDFILMGSKEEAERIKRKGLSLEQESAKKHKTSEEVTEEAKSSDEVHKEKVKEMMQLVPIEEGRIVGNKMHKAFPLQGIEFPLAEEVLTASEEGSHCQKKREATARKIALLSNSRRNCQSKSNDSFT
nr:hypothetical protein [Tanacetum cinerariifolium]